MGIAFGRLIIRFLIVRLNLDAYVHAYIYHIYIIYISYISYISYIYHISFMYISI